MRAKDNIKMTFICDQNWDAMKITENGRYCSLCKQEVFDFTSKTIAEINNIKAQKGQLCGNFRIDQVEQDLKPIEFRLLNKTKYWLATISTFCGLEISNVTAQNKAEIKTELHANSSKKITANTATKTQCDTTISATDPFKNKRPFMTTRGYKYYWTKQFPFVTARHKHRLRGKF